jgi:peptidoglycan/LPS O-acetylase OafA/YrhL
MSWGMGFAQIRPVCPKTDPAAQKANAVSGVSVRRKMLTSDQRFVELDGLRGLAALTVAVAHLSNANMGVVFGVPLAAQARIAVWVFFVLSAFLLTNQALAAASSGNRLQWTARYLLRRGFRIYPLFIVCVSVDLVVHRLPLAYGFEYITLTAPCCAYIYWSIPPEFQYYFLIPFVGIATASFPRITVAVLLAISLASITFARNYDLYAFLSTFCFGSIAAVLITLWPRIARLLSMAWPLAFVMAGLCSVPLVEATGWSIFPWDWNGLHGALWATVVLTCAFGQPRLAWLASWPMRHLGALSFSLYLTHLWVIAIAANAGLSGRFWAGPLLFPLMIMLAWLFHRLIEEPGRLFGRSLEEWPRRIDKISN